MSTRRRQIHIRIPGIIGRYRSPQTGHRTSPTQVEPVNGFDPTRYTNYVNLYGIRPAPVNVIYTPTNSSVFSSTSNSSLNTSLNSSPNTSLNSSSTSSLDYIIRPYNRGPVQRNIPILNNNYAYNYAGKQAKKTQKKTRRKFSKKTRRKFSKKLL